MKTLKDDLGFQERAFQKKKSSESIFKKTFSKTFFNLNIFKIKKKAIQEDPLGEESLRGESLRGESLNREPLNREPLHREILHREPMNRELLRKEPLLGESLNKKTFEEPFQPFNEERLLKNNFEQTRFYRKNEKSHRKNQKRPEKSFFSTFLKWAFGFVFLCMAGILTFLTLLYLHINHGLPKINNLTDYRPPTITNVFSDDGTKIGEFYKERRIVMPLSDMPPDLINAFIAAEDSRFREHVGIDLIGIIRAFIKNMRAGSIVQGGSTITQQVTKSFLLTPERTYKRKIKEAILAYRIDKTFSKEEILFLYLNQIYLGHAAYGVEAAAENYFGKPAKDLSLAECSMLAGLPQAPSRYSPFKNPELARQRQIYVLNRMLEENYISKDQMNQAMSVNLDIKPRKNWFSETVPWYTEYVRRYVIEKYGEDMIYNQGINIYTAVNIEFQKIAEKAVLNGLAAIDKRHGYGGPLKNISSLGIDSFSRKIAASIPNGGILEKNKVYKGVIIDLEVDKDISRVKVRVGNISGIIDISDMPWAMQQIESTDNAQAESSSEAQFSKDSSQTALKIGDVFMVKALREIEDTKESKKRNENADKQNKKNTEQNEIELEKESGEGKKSENKKSVKQKTKNAQNMVWEFSLELEPQVEGSLISIEAETGHVKAMVGGRNYQRSQFNRAVQSKRQPGSAFKPIIYAAALDKGYTTSSIIIDSPIAFKDGSNKIWKPQNYKEAFYGPTRLREALVKSRNVVTVKIVQDIGVDYVIEYARKLGITSPIEKNLSIALGSCGLPLVELVKAYTVFSNLGYLVEPVFITKIVGRDNQIVEEAYSKKEKVIDMSTAYIMTNMMESVVQSGTATKAKELGRPAAGKTGTTNDIHDALFVGYTPRYTTGVWVGFDKDKSLGSGESGAKSALPIWLEYMKGALEGKSVMSFNVPEGVVFHNVNPATGFLSDGEYGEVISECFKEDTLPTRSFVPTSEESDEPVTETEDLFKSDI
ncbi:MAG: PBP1A family penicillin-binding protein [Desulfamplus sp.]|nr:PBP1A family penicillin-binding protein [Desulfamplus sp.]